jgi:hypothetical protein
VAWHRDVFGAETAALRKLVDLTGLRVLEIGSGDGRLTRRYAPEAAEVLGIEPDEELVARARGSIRPSLPGERGSVWCCAVSGPSEGATPDQTWPFSAAASSST